MKTNIELQQRKQHAIARGQGNTYPVFIQKARNAEIWDVEGNRYIDLGAGIAVNNTGHSHPRIVEAVQAQVADFSHSCLMVNPYETAVTLAEKLNKLAPGKSPKKSMFVSTGAEAVENAIKIARAYTGRRGVIAFNGGFHGRTNLTMGLTGKVTPYKHLFGPFPAEIFHAAFPSEFHGVSVADSLKSLDNLFRVDIEPASVAAIIIEPVQGEGGFYPAPDELMQALRKLCDQHGILLIADEIQTGFGRTGRLFATEKSGIEPDLMTMAKGMAGGYPIAAVVGKSEIMDAPLPGGLGGTYGGSPVSCAAANAVIDIIHDENLVARASNIGRLFSQHLEAIAEKHPRRIGEIRINGAMMAIELVKGGDPDKPDPELTAKIVAAGAEFGLILLSCGFYGNVIRFLPPLTISDDLINEAMSQFSALFEQLA